MTSFEEELSPEQVAHARRAAARREDPTGLRFFLYLNLGLVLTALGVMVFKAPNHFALGGTSGLSIILSTLFPGTQVSTFMWAINAALVVLGLVLLDRRTIGWTVYSSFALSAYVSLFGWLMPLVHPLTDDTLLELCFAVLLPAIGSAIVFDIGASTGGTDILAMVLKKYTSLEIGKALMVSDAAIVAMAFVLYGPRTGLYCVLGLLGKSFVVDNVIESLNLRKVCTVISNEPDAVLDFLVRELERTATVRDAVGGFSMHPEKVIVTVLTRREASRLRIWLKRNDPGAFMTIVNSSEIIGRGFRSA
jgi:uncharacterized membrane-anchored protein YitT (DUF2179 family)